MYFKNLQIRTFVKINISGTETKINTLEREKSYVISWIQKFSNPKKKTQ